MTYSELYAYAKKSLSNYEAWCMMNDIFGMDRAKLAMYGSEIPDTDTEQKFLTAVQKRTNGVPLQYATNKVYFMNRPYFVGEGVLIPRDDTEVVVRECLNGMNGNENVIDLCSGSGIIAVTLAKEFPDANIYALELGDVPYRYLLENIAFHHVYVKSMQESIFYHYKAFRDEYFDIIISNPPYIRTDVIPTLQSEVQYEPKFALDGGRDGLKFYRCIAENWIPKLKQGGKIFLEIGDEQANAVSDLLKTHGITQICIVKDIQNLDRVVFGTKNRE